MSIISKVFNTLDTSTHHYAVSTFRHDVPLENHTPVTRQDQTSEYNVTTLTNGFTILTESTRFPGPVNMGIMLNVGTRDETPDTSGACLALKNVYLKTLKHTNETINYGMAQMTGGHIRMDYDQETMYFNGSCIEYDVSDIFQVLVDIAYEPKSTLAANVAKAKNRKSHELSKYLAKYDPFAYTEDLLLRTAYGYNTLGNPLLGLEHNTDYINQTTLQDFVLNNVTPGRSLIVANGVNNHNEFVQIAKERLQEFLPVPEQNYQRTASSYIGGEVRNWTETPNTSITLGFEGASWTSQNQPALQVAAAILGCSQQGYVHRHVSSISHRSLNIVNQNSFVDSSHGFNHHFTDSGLFGLTVTGSGSHSRELMDVALGQLSSLKNHINDEELHRAKNILKMNVLRTLENPTVRLEEVARNYLVYGNNFNFHRYAEIIDSVTSDQINSVSSLNLRPFPQSTNQDPQSSFKGAPLTSFQPSLMSKNNSDNKI